MGNVLSLILFISAAGVFSTPISQSQNSADIAGITNIHWPNGRPLPVKVTKTPSGQHIGWVKRHDHINGDIASPPPPKNFPPVNGKHHPTPELAVPGVETGPAGTVPFHLLTVEEVQKIPNKHPPSGKSRLESRTGNVHYYGSSSHVVTNYGGRSILSLFRPSVATAGSMSLIQIAEGNLQQGYMQTAESGWHVLPVLYQYRYVPRIFTYFTTNGYGPTGDNLGGYNTYQNGFVQYSSMYYPGMTFSNISTVGGTQYEVPLAYEFYQGNWWLAVNNNWVGYYPGSIYAKTQTGCSSPCINNTLGSYADSLGFYGEISDNSMAPPNSDMGSGMFANQGFGKAAYMHNLIYYSGINGAGTTNYSGYTSSSNTSWYTIEPHFNSTDSWASYFFVGGPGAG